MAPPSRLDGAYRSQRLRLTSAVTSTATGLWARGRRDEQQALEDVLRVVYAGQRQMVALVDAFMGIKARTGPQGLDPSRYTVEAIRGVPAEELYRRPWGALGGQLAQGASFASAADSAAASLAKLVRTDLQLSQTHAARDWMTGDPSVTAYRRDPGPDICDLCDRASQHTYHPGDLAPIHEHCSCGVIPLFDEASPVPVDASVRVVDDPGFGPRLLAADWAA